MSMRDYAVNDYGLLMTRETLKIIASKVCDGYTDAEYEDDEFAFNDELYDAGIVEYIGDFSGESIAITDDGNTNWGVGEDYCGDTIYYVPIAKMGTLFKAAYEDINEMIDEFKAKLGEYLPGDFDYRGYIRHISGTYYG